VLSHRQQECLVDKCIHKKGGGMKLPNAFAGNPRL